MSKLDIKSAMKRANVQAKDVAAKMGISAITLNSHINGLKRNDNKANPSYEILQRIASAIGCDILDLFEDEREIPQTTSPYRCPHCGHPLTIKVETE